MVSFFDKLKKGMGVEDDPEQEAEEILETPIKDEIPETDNSEILPPPAKVKQAKKMEKPKPGKKLEIKTITMEAPAKKKDLEKTFSSENLPMENKSSQEKWFDSEGQLAIDVYQTENDIVIHSAIAGVQPEDLDIIMEKDVIAIRGIRKNPSKEDEKRDYFSQECFWGPFSREIILPAEADPNMAKATMKAGVLIIRIPKTLREKKRKILVKES